MRFILLFLIQLIITGLFAQSDYSVIYIYRQPSTFNKIIKHKLFINEKELAEIESGTKVTYKVYSESKQEVRLEGYSIGRNEDVDAQKNIYVSPGNTYYLKVVYSNFVWTVTQVDRSIGQREFNEIKDKSDKVFNIEEEVQNRPVNSINTTAVNQVKIAPVQSKPKSDVDQNIPTGAKENPYRFALIIGNEDYKSFQTDLKSEVNVDFAKNDADVFKEYCQKSLGIPERNITFLVNATAGQMNQAITKICLLIQKTNGNGEAIIYYAGHGLPDESSKEAYLVPVDVNGSNLSQAVKLKDLYSKLSEFPSKRITVFLDACFSGGARNQGLVAARGVKVKPKEETLKGNIVVFSASSGEESSMPFIDKQHGLFTYFLLKKMQESNCDIDYKKLFEYIKEKVGLESILVNSKEQNPQLILSPDIQSSWENWTLK